jgi:DNA-binding NarL/FixJ family response regulator
MPRTWDFPAWLPCAGAWPNGQAAAEYGVVPATPVAPDALRARGVTAHEAEVLDLIADRLQNREIAGRLFLSPRTVEKHVASLLQKCQAADRAALVALGREVRMGRLD